jgi:hypothetical protein
VSQPDQVSRPGAAGKAADRAGTQDADLPMVAATDGPSTAAGGPTTSGRPASAEGTTPGGRSGAPSGGASGRPQKRASTEGDSASAQQPTRAIPTVGAEPSPVEPAPESAASSQDTARQTPPARPAPSPSTTARPGAGQQAGGPVHAVPSSVPPAPPAPQPQTTPMTQPSPPVTQPASTPPVPAPPALDASAPRASLSPATQNQPLRPEVPPSPVVTGAARQPPPGVPSAFPAPPAPPGIPPAPDDPQQSLSASQPQPDAAGAATDAASTRESSESDGPRKVRLTIARIDPWSAMKLSFLLSVSFAIATVVASVVLWEVLDVMGVFGSLNTQLRDIAGPTSKFDLSDYIGLGRVVAIATVVSLVNVVVTMALATLGAVLYNLAGSLVGGLNVTLSDD